MTDACPHGADCAQEQLLISVLRSLQPGQAELECCDHLVMSAMGASLEGNLPICHCFVPAISVQNGLKMPLRCYFFP